MRTNKFIWLNRVRALGLSYRNIYILILLSLVSTITEIFGISIFLPIVHFIRLEGDVDALVSDASMWQYIIDMFAFLNIELSLLFLLVISFSFFILRQIFVYFRLIYIAAVGQKIVQLLKNRMFNRYINADTSYHDKIPVGNLVSVMTTEVNGAVIGIMAPMDLIVYFIMLFGYLSMLAFLSWKMTLLSIAVLLLASAIPNIWIKKSVHVGRNLVEANTAMSEFLVGRLRSPRLVRLSGTEKEELHEFHCLTHSQRKHSIFSSILQARANIVMDPIVVGMRLIFLYFSYTVLNLQIEIIGLYLVIALRLLPVVKGVLVQWQTVQRTLGSVEVIERRLKEMRNAVEKDTGVRRLTQFKTSISINNVSYRYPSRDYDILKNITVEFKINQITAIVGPSGSGKSTLIDLLPCLRLPQKGEIWIDGLDIGEYSLESLRKMMSYAPQFPQIFTGTVKSHILLGRENATSQDIQEAICLAGIEDFINTLPQGIDTVLGEDAVKLSGGQSQRLDLARVLIKKAPILILDEPASNLDAKSEELLKQTFDRIREETNTAIIIVSHRLASISDADNIIVLNQGKIEASGPHLELLSQKGWYSEAWEVQSLIE